MGMPKLSNVILSLCAAVLVLFSAATEVRRCQVSNAKQARTVSAVIRFSLN